MNSSDAAIAISVLSGLEAVRKRPGLYIGSTDARGLHVMIGEPIVNAANQGVLLPKIRIRTEIGSGGVISIGDNARGMADRGLGRGGVPIMQSILAELYAGAKADSLSLPRPFGIGLSVVNALSAFFCVRSETAAEAFGMRCEKGKVCSPWRPMERAGVVGTQITFMPDPEIFGSLSCDLFRVLALCRDRLAIQPNIEFDIIDKRAEQHTEENISKTGGAWGILKGAGMGHRLFPKRLFHLEPRFPLGEFKPQVFAAALGFTKRSFARVASYVNFGSSPEGGSHVVGFQEAVDDAFGLAEVPRAHRAGLRRGMLGVIHVLHPKANWEGCTRSRVNTADLQPLVRQTLAPQLAAWMGDELLPHLTARERSKGDMLIAAMA